MDEIRNPLTGHNSKRRHSVYAVAFDLGTEELKRGCHVDSYNKAHLIELTLEEQAKKV